MFTLSIRTVIIVNHVTIRTPAVHGQASAFGTPVMGLKGEDKE